MRASILMLVLVSVATSARGQATPMLRAGPSSRATTEVRLTYPSPQSTTATPNPAVAGSAPMPTMPGMPATPAAPVKPLVIAIEYGQPHLRGRTLHTDSLLPYDKPWRMGANGSTILTTDVDLLLGGATLPKGQYVLYATPGRGGWKLTVQKSVGQSAMTYDAANDITYIDLRATQITESVESLTMWLIPSLDPGPAHGEFRMAWGTDRLSVGWSVKTP